jgi:hypothetical protein
MNNFKDCDNNELIEFKRTLWYNADIPIIDWCHKYIQPFDFNDFVFHICEFLTFNTDDNNYGYNVLNWFIANGFVLTSEIFDMIFENDVNYLRNWDSSIIDLLIWMSNNGYHFNKKVLDDKFADFYDHRYKDVYKKYEKYEKYENYRSYEPYCYGRVRNIFNIATYVCDLYDMKCLYLMGYTFDDKTMELAYDTNNREIIEWLCFMKCPNVQMLNL